MEDVLAIEKGNYRIAAFPEVDQKRTHQSLIAVAANEMNPVELAYSRRPMSPSYRIHMDQDVNGQAKKLDFIGAKYMDASGLIPFDVMSPKSGTARLSSEHELYCICREPYDPHDQKKMFQCEGPCQKWVHPSCFGETIEAIRAYEETGKPYVCMFCRPDTDCCKFPHIY